MNGERALSPQYHISTRSSDERFITIDVSREHGNYGVLPGVCVDTVPERNLWFPERSGARNAQW
jgi:hypothetical protein